MGERKEKEKTQQIVFLNKKERERERIRKKEIKMKCHHTYITLMSTYLKSSKNYLEEPLAFGKNVIIGGLSELENYTLFGQKIYLQQLGNVSSVHRPAP